MSDLTIELGHGYRAEVTVERDQDMGEPWKEHDGHGPVSEWTTRDKAPGERLLCVDHSHKRYYDFAEAVRIAKREGWDAPPYKTGTKAQQAARAAEADYERLRGWCNDQWHWTGVCVTVFDRHDAEIADDSVWGVESDGDYWEVLAREMAFNLAEDDREKRRTHWRGALQNAREQRRLLDLNFASL